MDVKSLEELNRDFISRHVPAPKPAAKPERPEAAVLPKVKTAKPAKADSSDLPRGRRRLRGKIGLFTALVLLCLAAAPLVFPALDSGGDGTPRRIAGYSYFTVLTSSMQDEIPRDSFILVKQTDPRDIRAGDNITYTRDAGAPVTHKVVGIYEDYLAAGARGFRTQGTNSEIPDKDVVPEANVVGKVIFTLPGAGAVLSRLESSIRLVAVILAACVLLSFGIQRKSTLSGVAAKKTAG
ncbi:MAG: signal peptidase I [Oscillospiraceae bacterium]|nr:signal peptidase I [Oscillospiraceae bacterium]